MTLLFSVPCSALLQPFEARGVYQEACEDALALAVEQQPICADCNMVVLLLDAEGFENTTIHFFEERNYNIVNNIHRGCIFMQMGVFLVDVDVHNNKPTSTHIKNLLQRNTFHKKPSRIPRLKWERQHHLLTLTPRKNMMVELLFNHNNNIGNVAVGVDDVQLFPVLSESTKVAHKSLLFPNGCICTSIHVPTQQQLAILGLAHLVRGNESFEQDNWERLHVTVAIKASDDAVHCQFTGSLFYVSENTHDTEVCQAPFVYRSLGQRPPHSLKGSVSKAPTHASVLLCGACGGGGLNRVRLPLARAAAWKDVGGPMSKYGPQNSWLFCSLNNIPDGVTACADLVLQTT
jgi:hypothetical protein